MGVLCNRSYVDRLNCARIYCSIAVEDAYILTEIATDVFSCYENDAIISFRQDIEIGNRGTGSELTGSESEAQLVIAVISRNYLNQKKTDLGMQEFYYAIDNNIPVLPILIEQGLEDDFNGKCGKLELIFKYNMAYSSVLRENLNRLLTGREIKNKIREHFYGSIFLSYRRLDAYYAKETMKKVHEFDNCKDVGIWYDGALVPGEDYEEEIFEKLRMSDCVLMVITSRLLEEGNFIMKEYPRVKKSGMTILPYIVEDVDHNQLSELYKGLFDQYPLGIRGEEELQKAISDIYPSHENAWDEEHYFYIGLASLYGVDFEHDTEKAIRYLKSAAEAGYKPAFAELVRIYAQGIGIEANLTKAITWQNSYIIELKKDQKIPCFSSNVLVEEMLRLSGFYEKVNDYKRAKDTYNSIIACFDLKPQHEQKKEYYLSIAIIYEAMGLLERSNKNNCAAQENLFLAEKYIDNAERVAENLNERKSVAFEYSRVAEEIAMTLCLEESKNSLNLADTYIQLAIKPYEENCYSDDFCNEQRAILSRLYYEEGFIEKKKFDMMCMDDIHGKAELLEQLDWVRDLLMNAYEWCTETDYNKSIRNITAYYNLILILEELKNTYFAKCLLKSTASNLDWYENYLRQMMHIFINVHQNEIAQNALINIINECIFVGEFFATHKYKDKAKEFHQLALSGMHNIGLSDQSDEVKTVKDIIE